MLNAVTGMVRALIGRGGDSPHTNVFDQVFASELDDIAERKGSGVDKDNLSGLALSGGGIRSASFAIGVLQALRGDDAPGSVNYLARFDYLSTVSGGGYTGAALTWFDRWSDRFPFGRKMRGARIGARIGDRDDNRILDFIRQHSNYLVPGRCLNGISLLAIVLRSILLALAVYLPVLALLFRALRASGFYDQAHWLIPPFLPLGPWHSANAGILIAGHALVFFVILSFVYSLLTYPRLHRPRRRYRFRYRVQCLLGISLTVAAVMVALGVMPHVVDQLGAWWAKVTAAGSGVTGAALALWRRIKERDRTSAGDSALDGIQIRVAAALVVYAFLILAYSAAVELDWSGDFVKWALGIAFFTGIAVNLNYVAPHRMYRDRLMEAFMADPATVAAGRWALAGEANATPLSDFAAGPGSGRPSGDEVKKPTTPYPLINTNMVLINSGDSRFHGRGGDSFILSPRYCGGDATGWRKTANFMHGRLTLATAMAISGAAVNPQSGSAGRGVTRSRSVSFLMTLFNIRLGYWAPNPRSNLCNHRLMPPNYFYPGYKGLLNVGFRARAAYIELTDGGHFDNTGVYELVRRRTRVIVLADGSADPDFKFGDLGNMVERVRVDFGANIRFRGDHDLAGILPGSRTEPKAMARKYGLAERGWAVGTITYPKAHEDETREQRTGIFIYIKTDMTTGLAADIYAYKAENPKFPDQSTGDQFFDENQFEAYRELGYQTTRDVIDGGYLGP